jgi:putative MATE family efflux protein
MNESSLSIKTSDLLKVALPMSLGAFIQFFVAFTDNYFVAKISGNAMSAVSYIGLLYITLVMITTGISSALQIIIARRYGENHWDQMNTTMRNGWIMGICIAAIQWSLMHFAVPVFIEGNIDHEEIRYYMYEFMSCREWGFWVYTPTLILQAYWTGIAKTRVVLYTMLITSIGNIILDYWLVYGGMGIEPLGAKGAALATVSAETIAFIFILIYSFKYAGPQLKRLWTPLFNEAAHILKIGLPIVFQMLIALGVWLAFYTLVAKRGPKSLQSAFIVRNMYMLAWVSVMGFSAVTRTYTSALLGEQRWGDLKKFIIKAIFLNLAGILILSHGLWLYPEWLTAQFTQDAETTRLTILTMQIIVPAMLIYSLTSILLAVVEGSGSTIAGFWIEVITSFCYVAFVWTMVHYTQWEVHYLWTADYLYFVILGICSAVFLRWGNWKNQTV